jgi:hypothetical protein
MSTIEVDDAAKAARIENRQKRSETDAGGVVERTAGELPCWQDRRLKANSVAASARSFERI